MERYDPVVRGKTGSITNTITKDAASPSLSPFQHTTGKTKNLWENLKLSQLCFKYISNF